MSLRWISLATSHDGQGKADRRIASPISASFSRALVVLFGFFAIRLVQFGCSSIIHKYLARNLHLITMVKGTMVQLVFPAFLLMTLMVAPCFSLPRIAGVHKGEYYKYADINLSWNFNQ